MRRMILGLAMLALAAPAMAAQHLRIDLSGVGATDGPSPGFAIGADVQIDPAWFWTLRGSRLAEDDAASNSLALGLEYGLAAGELVPYLSARAGGRWTSQDVAVCSIFLAAGNGQGDPHPDPELYSGCRAESVTTSGFLYQAAFGIDWLPKGSRFGATAEAAWTDAAGEAGVEFLFGVSIRP